MKYNKLRAAVCRGALVAGMLGSVFAAQGEEAVRAVHSAYMVEVGSSHLGDTYLSPLKYTGWSAGFAFDRMQPMKLDHSRWNSNLRLAVAAEGAENPARNADMYYFNLNASWGMLRRFALPWGLGAGAGPVAEVNAGCVYNARNGNNPASVKADITVGAGAYLTRRIRVGKLPVMLKWQTQLPLTGVFFSPEYDELYYEIYLGNRHGLAHMAWPGNFFRWDNLLTAELLSGNTQVVIGGRSRVYSTGVNHINTRIFSWSFVVGVSGNWMSLPAAGGVSDSTREILYAY